MGNLVKKSKAQTLAHVQAVIAGTEKHFPSSTWTIGNASFTTASLVKLLTQLVDTLVAVEAAQKGAKDAVTAMRASNALVGPTLRSFERIVQATFGNASQTLAEFNLTPPKARRTLTSDQKAAAAARAKATRKLRGTIGPRKKALIKAPPEVTTQAPLKA